MADIRVTCINKPNRMSSHDHITHIGGGGMKWTREEAIRLIDSKVNTFYVADAVTGKRSYVGVVRPGDGRAAFLQTYADGVWNNNLLALPECS